MRPTSSRPDTYFAWHCMDPADGRSSATSMPSQDRPAVEAFFAESPFGLEVFDAVAAIVDRCGEASVRVSKTQVAFRRRTGFAFLWMPGRWLKKPSAQIVLTIDLRRRDDDNRWKQVVQVSKTRWTHHLELQALHEIDDQVAGWLAESWRMAE